MGQLDQRMEAEKLAIDLLKMRIAAYWSHQDAVGGEKWRSVPGDQSAKEWYAECLKLATAIIEEKYKPA